MRRSTDRLPSSLLGILLACSALSLSARVCAEEARAEFGDQGLQILPYNNPGLTADLGVGLWSWPLPMDFDEDGDCDLVVSCGGKPNGLFFFENPGGDTQMPLFRPAVRIDSGLRNVQVSYVDGEPRVLTPNKEFETFRDQQFRKGRKLSLATNIHPNSVRANEWKYVDFDADGALDLLVGVGDWTDYGWDDAFNANGVWTRGPLHGYVYLIRNSGSNDRPAYEEPVKLETNGEVIDVYGMPTPNMADFDGDGDLDLLCGEFVDKFTYFENVGSRSEPRFRRGEFLKVGDAILHVDACMFVPVAVDWDNDGDIDVVSGQEDGTVLFIENTGRCAEGIPVFEPPRAFQQQADAVKFGVLATPTGFDWDGDGDEDLICGSASGRIAFIENLGGYPPHWNAPVCLAADGREIRIQAGKNGSVQGPCEAKWGYTVVCVADWDQDGLPDLLANSIWGKILWYRNIGTREEPVLASPVVVQVQWDGDPRGPEWNWWKPQGNEFVTQWRSSIQAIDLTGDGLLDLVALDEDGYLALFERTRSKGEPILKPGKRVFAMAKGEPLVFDHNQRPTSIDENHDGQNDLAQLNSNGELAFYYMKPIDGAKKTAVRMVNRRSDSRYSDSDTSCALRLNAGWAGRSGRRKFVLVDWDQDGKLDLLVNSTNVNFLKNVAESSNEYVFRDMGPVDELRLAGHTTCPTTVDWDSDGIPDLVVGDEGGFFYYLNNPSDQPAVEKGSHE